MAPNLDTNPVAAKRAKLAVPDEAAAQPAREELWRSNLRNDASLSEVTRPEWWWTGKKPQDSPGYIKEAGYLSSLPLPNLKTTTREQALQYFDNTWSITETLFSALVGEEPFYRPPYHELRHPLIFYYGHPAVLYINKLRVAGVLDKGINEYYESIFEVGVDEMSWDDLSKNDMDWPSVREVNDYRRKAYEVVKNLIQTHPSLDSLPVTESNSAWSIFMSFEHERIHIETSSVLMRELPEHLVRKPADWPPYHPSAVAWTGAAGAESSNPPPAGSAARNVLQEVAAGDVLIGKPRAWPSFGWDNEYGERKIHVRQFQASKHLVSNGEYHAFVKAGGYATERFWSEAGWRWRTFRNSKWPTFWVKDGPEGLHKYKLRLQFDVVDMAWDLPVDVNYHEGKAFCAWKSEQEGVPIGTYRLLSEAEHHRIRDTANMAEGRVVHDPVMALTGAAFKAPGSTVNTNFAFGSQHAVDALPAAANGFHDVMGSVWQWCEDFFAALPGFKVHPFYDDFSTPCFDGQHNVIMGGSWASSGQLASLFARYHFRPHFFQHAGFRMVKSTHQPILTSMDAPPPPPPGGGPPSSDPSRSAERAVDGNTIISQYLQQHFSTEAHTFAGAGKAVADTALSGMIRYPQRIAARLADKAAALGIPTGRALDIGCAVGGTCFELARHCEEVIGLDQSAAIIGAANRLRTSGTMELFCPDEGELTTTIKAVVDPTVDRAKVSFKQMDAMCLSPALGEFDLVVVSNLLEALISPGSCLGRLAGRQGVVKVGGLVLVASTYDWDARLTPQDLWLGGRRDAAGEQLRSREGLAKAMGKCFELTHEENMPQVCRINARKYEVVVTNVTIWRRTE
eukprot:CAMPEP_0118958176 /NCGR_PEP_ID=MMETSP1169-20130426/62490_1 /TAXON_ID=36882 /ORGANISM="Pyramimonas obovata, Strain CCMP722" /LENGTH=849 /DNA_ID=CAMNT_0006906289 /DNA_START=50 /DNA_END=2599 /DNA_ORIENTATION=+